jgi:hypothetical protein
VHERFPLLPKLALRQRKREQAHAAVDVVADASRRDDAVRELARGHAADGEAVALVGIRHRQRRLDDPGQRRDVLGLAERAVALDCLEQLLVGEHARWHAHVRARVRRDLPQHLADPPGLTHPSHLSR